MELATAIISLFIILAPVVIRYFLDKKIEQEKIRAEHKAEIDTQLKQDQDRESEISDLNRKIHEAEAELGFKDKT